MHPTPPNHVMPRTRPPRSGGHSRGLRFAAIVFVVIITIAVGALFIGSSFHRSTDVAFPENPLWDSHSKPRSNALTQDLQNLGLTFKTGMGEEAYPSGIAFAEMNSDEYWIVTYFPEEKHVHAFALIHQVNWLGHISYNRRFQTIQDSINRHAGRK